MNKIICAVLVLFFISGCATTKKNNDIDERLSAIESKMNLMEQKQVNAEDRLSSLEITSSSHAEAAREITDVNSAKNKNNQRINLSKKDIQSALKNAGYYDGLIDGKFGKATIKSLKKFQKKNGLKPNGKINKETKKKLAVYLK